MNSENKEILDVIKDNISKNNYQISFNENRKDNIEFKRKYELNEKDLKDILLKIKEDDYYDTVSNYKTKYQSEKLHIFMPTIEIENDEGEVKKVKIYTKFNIVKENHIVVVSLHEAKK